MEHRRMVQSLQPIGEQSFQPFNLINHRPFGEQVLEYHHIATYILPLVISRSSVICTWNGRSVRIGCNGSFYFHSVLSSMACCGQF